jgi:alkanesulfonate monooxygenase SsuD/methylene tetrahydromethanopterin reductase-like flavin-dependent oxidoreductase (luciferase family)
VEEGAFDGRAPVAWPERLSIGLMLPQEEGPGDPTPSWAGMSAAARLAEDVGVDSLWLVDHLLWATDPWDRNPADFGEQSDPRGYGTLEAWTSLAALAASTRHVRLGTLVSCTRYRNPGLLAKMADSVEDVSGGRLVLGLGAGDNRPEHEALGIPTDRPISHFEEALQIIVPLLRTGQVDFEGSAYRAHLELKPRASRAGGPPILIGSLTSRPRVLGLVARFADIWNGWLAASTPAQVKPLRDAIDGACRAFGRDPATLARSITLVVAMDGPMTRLPGAITGSIDEIAQAIAPFAEEGIDEVQVRLFPNDLPTIERFGRVLEAMRGSPR